MFRTAPAVCLALLMICIPLTALQGQSLRVVEGLTSATLRVPSNRAVVVESDVLFSELSVANPDIADIATLSERSIYVLGRRPGRTTLTLLGADGTLLANVELQVVPDVAELRERLREVIPGESVEVRTASDGIILSGTVSSGQVVDRAMALAELYAAGRVSNLMMVGGSQQVMLQVRFAEMQRTVRQELSSSLGLNADFGGGGASVGTGATQTGSSQYGLGNSLPPGTRNGGLGISFASSGLQVSVLLEALEANGLVRTLAEPNLTALSGQSADFLAGGEYPIPVQSEDGVGVEFRPFGVNMSFTPTVVDGSIINLLLEAEVSSIGEIQPGTNVPALSTRRAATTVEMRDGESFAIAGLLQDDFASSVGQVPWLGDLPVLGALFRSSSFRRAQSELVIIVTAHLVTPVRGEALSLPTDRVRLPSERDLFLLGRVDGGPASSGPVGEVARQQFQGSFGYVME